MDLLFQVCAALSAGVLIGGLAGGIRAAVRKRDYTPEQADYANNMSELIVAVLTVVSIAFAFYEFVRRK